MFDILPSRRRYDLFQNTACRAISESAIACNTNLQLLTGGPVSAYQFKYHIKPTEEDDTNEYDNVQTVMKKLLTAETSQVHDITKKEAMRRVLRAAFAHNSENVIGAPLASHLLRHKERFVFSHDFAHIPVDHIIKLVDKQQVPASLCHHSDGSYFQNRALNYLCRSPKLDHISVFDFYTHYESVFLTKDNRKIALPYSDTAHFAHPSMNKNGDARQGVLKRDRLVLPKIQQWAIPDAASFNGDILSPSTPMTSTTEHYARFILTLFLPHRCRHDLIVAGGAYPFTQKLRQVVRRDDQYIAAGMEQRAIFGHRARDFLNNVQDSRSNCFRCKIPDDDLTMTTEKLNCKLDQHACLIDPDEIEQEAPETGIYESTFISAVLSLSSPDTETAGLLPNGMPRKLHLKQIRSKGAKKCGKFCLSRPPETHTEVRDHLVQDPFILTSNTNPSAPTSNTPPAWPARKTYTHTKLATLILDRTSAVRREANFDHNPTPDVPLESANGSARGIIRWAKAANLDRFQRRAFEITAASFLLTFFREASTTETDDRTQYNRHVLATFRAAKAKLIRLAAYKNGKDQMVLLLHGPGGSGKSTVVNLLLLYAREFCELLGHPFTSQTIVVSAFSGVAATLIKGDTTHRSCGLQ